MSVCQMAKHSQACLSSSRGQAGWGASLRLETEIFRASNKLLQVGFGFELGGVCVKLGVSFALACTVAE